MVCFNLKKQAEFFLIHSFMNEIFKKQTIFY